MNFDLLLASHMEAQTYTNTNTNTNTNTLQDDEDDDTKAKNEKKSIRKDDINENTENNKKQKTTIIKSILKSLPKIEKYLIIIPAGDDSLHSTWRLDECKNIVDVCIIYYGKYDDTAKKYHSQSKYFIRKRGPKWQLIRTALLEEFWKLYDYIWLPDDDLQFEQEEEEEEIPPILRLFRTAYQYSLSLCQPALIDNGNITTAYRNLLKHQPDSILHYTNFVEIMCPMLSFNALKCIQDTINHDDTKSGWGLDSIWPTLLEKNFIGVIAVIDLVPIIHTRPPSAFTSGNAFYREFKIDPGREEYEALLRYHVNKIRPRILQSLNRQTISS